MILYLAAPDTTLSRHEADAASALDEGRAPQSTALPDAGSFPRGSTRVSALHVGILPVGISRTGNRSRDSGRRNVRDRLGRGNLSRWPALRHAWRGSDARAEAARRRLCARSGIPRHL